MLAIESFRSSKNIHNSIIIADVQTYNNHLSCCDTIEMHDR